MNTTRSPSQPKRLVLQWHLTNRCNLHCRHCYQQSFSGQEPDGLEINHVIDQFKDLLAKLGKNMPAGRIAGHINVTGGEPFLRRDFFDILETLHANKNYFSFGILANGTLINGKAAKKTATFAPSFVQVSMEGSRETHDSIRGPGSYAKTVKGIIRLRRHGIPTLISFTAHKKNYTEFPEVARMGRRLRVSRVWADRFIPEKNDADSIQNSLTPELTQDFFKIMQKSRRHIWPPLTLTKIKTHRALQFLANGAKNPYSCSAGKGLVTLMPNGDVYPCRRLPILAGNVNYKSLGEIYQHSGIFNSLRDESKTTKGCEGCIHESTCRGGLKCLSYAVTGDPFNADPGCWLAKN